MKSSTLAFLFVAVLILPRYLYALCLAQDDVTFYAGPGKTFAQTAFNQPRHTALQPMEVWNDWIQVKDVDGDIHWVHSQFVLKNIFCATIKIDYVDMREGPGEFYSHIAYGRKYQSFLFGQRVGKWTQLIADSGDNYTVWIRSKQVWVQ